MKRIMFILAATMLTLNAAATDYWDSQRPDKRVTFGLRAGVNASKQYATDFHADQDFRLGYQAVLALDVNIIRSFSISTGLTFYQKGWKNKYEDNRGYIKQKDNAMYLEIPVLASYRIELNDKVGFQLNCGPYFAYGIGGKTKTSSDFAQNYNYEQDSFDKAVGNKRFDCGISLGAAFTVSHVYLGIHYERGLVNKSQIANYEYKNGTVAFNIGYNF